ncbi:unnamed protein product [marine sediment metagenome]|uniref:Uncharacterized protein n=1 Tax=marine sediment metagenome TaxID=412755 RepID=X1P722_9ZZZZ
MELACLVLLGILGFVVLVIAAGIIACECEKRKRKKNEQNVKRG